MDVQKVAKEAVCLWQSRFAKTKCRPSPLAYLSRVLPATVVRNAQSRQSKTGCGNARHVPGIWPASLAAVLHEPGRWIHLVPEKLKARTFQFLEKAVFLQSESVSRGITAEQRAQTLRRWRRYLRRERSGILPSLGPQQLRGRRETQRHTSRNTRGQPQPVAARKLSRFQQQLRRRSCERPPKGLGWAIRCIRAILQNLVYAGKSKSSLCN